MASPDVRTLLEAGVHFGHQTRRWNPKMKPFIFMRRNGIHIIDLAKTVAAMKDAETAIFETVRGGGKILFVCTKRQGHQIVKEEAGRCGMLYMTERWLGGTLTNLQTVRKSVKKLEDIEKMAEDGTYELISKRERLKHDRAKAKLLNVLDGIRDMKKPPGLVFIIDTKREEIAVSEAGKLRIPIVGVVDTNANPDLIVYPIPGNDDAIRSIRLFAAFVADCVLEAKAHQLEGKDAVEPDSNKAPEAAKPAAAGKPAAEVVSEVKPQQT